MLDLCDCEFIDSTGIALIVRSWQRLDRDGGDGVRGGFVLCSHNHQVRRLLQITGVESTISLHEQRDDALSRAARHHRFVGNDPQSGAVSPALALG